MQRRTKFLATASTAVIAAVVAAVIFASGSGAAVAPPISVSQMQALVSSTAANMGEGSPTDVTYSAQGTRNQVLAATGSSDTIGGAAGSADGYFVIEAHGNFKAYQANLPPGDNVYPTGQVLFLIVDAATGNVTDTGMGPAGSVSPNLSALGAVTSIPAPASRSDVTTAPTS